MSEWSLQLEDARDIEDVATDMLSPTRRSGSHEDIKDSPRPLQTSGDQGREPSAILG
jgi:hypothetical protein